MDVIIDEKKFRGMDEKTRHEYKKYLGMLDAEPAIGKVKPVDTNVIPASEYDELYLEDGDEMTYEEYSAKMGYICQVLNMDENWLMSLLPISEFKEFFIDRKFGDDGPISHAFGSIDFQTMFPRPKWSPFKAEKKELFDKLHDLILRYTCVTDEAGKAHLKRRIKGTCLDIRELKKGYELKMLKEISKNYGMMTEL